MIAAPSGAAAECVIEFESKSGSKMRIQWKGSGAPDWSSLLRAWREAEAMIHITAQMRVLVAIEAVDGRKGIDSLVRVCQEKLSEDPIRGCVFIFRSRRGTSIRVLSV